MSHRDGSLQVPLAFLLPPPRGRLNAIRYLRLSRSPARAEAGLPERSNPPDFQHSIGAHYAGRRYEAQTLARQADAGRKAWAVRIADSQLHAT